MRNIAFAENEYYHLFNRGVDKRSIFSDEKDVDRFFESIEKFNSTQTIGSIRDNLSTNKKIDGKSQPNQKLVNLVAYCVNPNHYHFILKQVAEKGIEKFMHKLGTGHTKYFNTKHKRTGSLFQGPYKAIHINSNEYLLYVSAYVNLNNRVHKIKSLASDLMRPRTSWDEYLKGSSNGLCKKDVVLEQFKNVKEYKKFAESVLEQVIHRRDELKHLESSFIE